MKQLNWKIGILLSLLPALIWLGSSEIAEARSRGQGNIYFGGGFLRELNSYKFNSIESNFTGWGATGIAGIEFELNGSFGTFFEGEYTRHELLNTLQSTTYLEKATNTALLLKAGVYYGLIGLGFAASQNQIDVDNVSRTSNGSRTSCPISRSGATQFLQSEPPERQRRAV